MTQFRTLYLIEHTDHMYGAMHVCSLTRRASLKYFICIQGEIHEFGDDDDYEAWKNNILNVIEKAREICEKNNFDLWSY